MIDVSICVNDAWFRLGFQDSGDMAFAPWLAPNELYQFADDAVKRVAATTAAFLTYDASVTVTPFTAIYNLPPGHVFTESAWIVFGPQLRITPTAELFALDAAPGTTSGPPARISYDAAAVGQVVLYPVPNINGTLGLLSALLPPTVSNAATTIALSPAAQDYFTYAALAGALGKESDSAKPEVAEHMRERMRAYEAIFTALWGDGR